MSDDVANDFNPQVIAHLRANEGRVGVVDGKIGEPIDGPPWAMVLIRHIGAKDRCRAGHPVDVPARG